MQNFFIKWNGKYNNLDGIYGPQCVDIVNQYLKDVHGLPHIYGNAIDFWRDVPGFTRIKKTWLSSPLPGDIVIWNIGTYGHVAICNWSRRFDLGVFEQNYPLGSPCQFGERSYKNVIGWLRPKRSTMPQNQRNIKMVYLSDSDDIGPAVAYCNAKLKEFTGGLLGVSYVFKPIPPVTAFVGFDLSQDRASEIVDTQTYEQPFHWVVLSYYGNNVSPGYSTQTSLKKNIWYTSGYKPYSPETLLFELKHFAVNFYNQHGKDNPYIENYDNYKSADGGLAKVEEQIKAILPYISVFKL